MTPSRGCLLCSLLLLLSFISTPAWSATLEGYVTDPEGRPVAGASVKSVQKWAVEGSKSNERESLSCEGVSGTDGAFILEGLRESTNASLYACLDGYAAVAESVLDLSETAWIALKPSVRITGRILDPKRRPIAGAKVKLQARDLLEDSPCSGSFSSLSSKDGSFRLEAVPPGYDSLEIHPQDFLSARRVKLETPVDQNLDGLDIVLAPEATITGVVRDPEGIPVASASISIEIEALTEPRVRTSTGHDGTYRLHGVPAGEHEVVVSDFDYATTRHTLRVKAGENHYDLTLGPKLKKIRVRLVGLDGEPIKEKRWVLALFSDHKPCSSGFIGDQGSFELRVSHPDKEDLSCTIMVSDVPHPGYFRSTGATFIIGHEPTEVVEARLNRDVSITGRVLGVQPEELSRVKIRGTFGVWGGRRSLSVEAIPDAAGFYRLERIESEASVDPGQVWISAALGTREIRHEVTLQPGQTEAVLDLEFPPTYPVHGRVLGPDGEAVEGAVVSFYRQGVLGKAQIQTQVDGSFSLELNKGEYGVAVQREGYGKRNDLKLVVADAAVENFEIRIRLASSRIRGRLLGLEPWESAYVKIWGPTFSEAEVDKEGNYQSSDLADGEWEVEANVTSRLVGSPRRRVHGRVTSKPGQEALLDLDVSQGPWTLSGHLFKAGQPFANYLQVRSEDSSRSGSVQPGMDGSFRLPGLHPGIYRLQAWDSESKEYREWTFEISSDLTRIFEWTEGVILLEN